MDDDEVMRCATESTVVRSSSDSLLELCKDTIGEESFSHLSDFRDECGIMEGGGPGEKDGQGPPGEGQGPPGADGADGGPLVAFFVLLTCCCGVGGVAAYRNKNQIRALLRGTFIIY